MRGKSNIERNNRFPVMLSDDEHAKLAELADSMGMFPAHWIRQQILSEYDRLLRTRAELRRIKDELDY